MSFPLIIQNQYSPLMLSPSQTSCFYDLRAKIQRKFTQQDLDLAVFNNIKGSQCKLRRISFETTLFLYEDIMSKYQLGVLQRDASDWNKKQRQLFLEILIWYCCISKKSPNKMNQNDWEYLSRACFNKNPMFLKFMGLSVDRSLDLINWSSQDDENLIKMVGEMGQGKWNQIAKSLFYQSGSTRFLAPKKCRQRWFNHLSPKIKRGNWTQQEDLVILEHVYKNNRHWCQLTKKLNYQRTQHMVKNRYKSLVKANIRKNKRREMRFIGSLIQTIKNKLGDTEIRSPQLYYPQRSLNSQQNQRERQISQQNQVQNPLDVRSMENVRFDIQSHHHRENALTGQNYNIFPNEIMPLNQGSQTFGSIQSNNNVVFYFYYQGFENHEQFVPVPIYSWMNPNDGQMNHQSLH